MKKSIKVTVYNRDNWRVVYKVECIDWWEADAIERQYNGTGYYVEVKED